MATKIKITRVHPKDAYYPERDEVIGLIGYAGNISNTGHEWYSFDFIWRGQCLSFMFADFEIL